MEINHIVRHPNEGSRAEGWDRKWYIQSDKIHSRTIIFHKSYKWIGTDMK